MRNRRILQIRLQNKIAWIRISVSVSFGYADERPSGKYY